jgi:putative transposase
VTPNLIRELVPESLTEVVFSDIFEIQLADRTNVQGCFTLWKRTRHILGLVFEDHMRADLVTTALHTLHFEAPEAIFHSDQGKQFGAQATRQLLLVEDTCSRGGYVLLHFFVAEKRSM